MPLPHDDRFPEAANPDTFCYGTPSGDIEDLSDTDAALLDDLFTLELWDDIEQYEAELGCQIDGAALRYRVRADEHRTARR